MMAHRSSDNSHGGEEQEPGVPKYYFLRKSVKPPPPKPAKASRPGKMTRSDSLPTQLAVTVRPESGRLRAVRGSALRPAKPLTLAALAQDLAPSRLGDGQEAASELPPGIVECRSKLEAFRNAAVEAISMEALLQVEQQRRELPPLIEERPTSRTRKQGRPLSATASEGTLPGVDECRRKLLAFREIVERAERAEAATKLIRG
mmetsp:Transcript_41025/g.76287  ORF Transcript_41025/g.76287 Transcript_41025/m.76287 type:complete len:203 (+) Transcript_41025:58-666(+)